MKTAGRPDEGESAVADQGPDQGAAADGGTRLAVARLLLEQGPVTAAAVAAELELSGAAVRRHLDALIADGEAEARQASRRANRGRGRPAREYLLTDAGRARFGHGYDDLAASALRFLAEMAGGTAVSAFAENRVLELLGPQAAEEIREADSADARTDALAKVLTARGYAAQARSAAHGVQLCQHHCPVAHVAAEFPELCEAETKAFAQLLGTHVQRLATIARGDATCTTHVPLEDTSDVLRRLGTDHSGPQATVPVPPEDHALTTTTGPTTTVPTGRQPE
ncbi:MAG: HTH domain-containing protein [Pseudonocardiaceae bacterium]|nr:MAG: HTH domain-containing protein [Pseudonocardiaceae bacterium]